MTARYIAQRTDRGWSVQTDPERYTVCVVPFPDPSGRQTAQVLADALNAADVPHQFGVLEALPPPPPPTRLPHDGDPVPREGGRLCPTTPCWCHPATPEEIEAVNRASRAAAGLSP